MSNIFLDSYPIRIPNLNVVFMMKGMVFMLWIITIHDHHEADTQCFQYEGTEDEVRAILENLINIYSNPSELKKVYKNYLGNIVFDHNCFSDGLRGLDKMEDGRIYGFVQYVERPFDFTAVKFTDIPKIAMDNRNIKLKKRSFELVDASHVKR